MTSVNLLLYFYCLIILFLIKYIILILNSYLKAEACGAEEVAQQLGALASLQEDLGLILNSHTGAQNQL